MSERLVEDGGRWEVATERSQEANRTGYGLELLEVTLKHLTSRGDRHCRVWSAESASWVELTLPRG